MPAPTAIIEISDPPRSAEKQPTLKFHAAQAVLTRTWGLQPGTALVDWASIAQHTETILPGAAITIEVGGHTFYGLSVLAERTLSESGHGLMMEFADSRFFLGSDVVYGAFNLRDYRWVGGTFKRCYRHLLPGSYNRNEWLVTDAPYTAGQILDYLFGAPTVESPWFRVHCAALANPVYDFDFTSGRKLGEAVMAVSEKAGTTFTLQGGRYRLVWAVKGVGTLPAFPANSTNRRVGVRVTGNPTRVRVIGERNLYQVLNVVMQPDWLAAWQQFWDLDQLVFDLYDHDVDEMGVRYNANGMEGYLRAAERARRITVGEYAALRDARLAGSGAAFRDFRRIAGRSRLWMPAALYIQYLLFRAFRLPDGFRMKLWNGQVVGAGSLDIVEQSLVETIHHPVTGVMNYTTDLTNNSNGYAIARGYQVSQDGFKTLQPEHFNSASWGNVQQLWQHITFSVDNSGQGDQFILFDEPVIATTDLFTRVRINGLPQGYALLNAGAVVTVPPVVASLTLAGERWSYLAGTGWLDAVEAVSGLAGQFVLSNPGTNFSWVEVPYADGGLASQRSAAVAAQALNRPCYQSTGGYTVQGSNGTELSPMLERVTVTFNADSGLQEQVEFVSETVHQVDAAGRLTLEPPQDYERRARMGGLLPGQEELRQEARALRSLTTQMRKDPRFGATLAGAFYQLVGFDAPPAATLVTGGSGLVAAGTPYWRPAASTLPVAPGTAVTAPVFVGAAVWEGDRGAAPRLTTTGIGGVILVRVQAPFTSGDSVGLAASAGVFTPGTCLVKTTEKVVGTVQDTAAGTAVVLAPVRLGAPAAARGGGATIRARVVDVRPNYLRCREWDGTTLGGTDLWAARQPTLRCRDRQTIAGIEFTYTYATPTSRLASFTINGVAYEEMQIVIPSYESPENEVFLTPVATGLLTEAPDAVGVAVDHLEQGPRAWTTVFGSDLMIQTTNGQPTVPAVREIVVPHGTLTNNNNGRVTLT